MKGAANFFLFRALGALRALRTIGTIGTIVLTSKNLISNF